MEKIEGDSPLPDEEVTTKSRSVASCFFLSENEL